jgi:hypothetical protein
MAKNVSGRLQAALERLDQTIDRLDGSLTEHLEQAEAQAKPVSPLVAERLDLIIKRIELALAE